MPEILNVSAACPRISKELPDMEIPDHIDTEGVDSIKLTFDCNRLPGCSMIFEVLSDYPTNGAATISNIEGVCPLQTTREN